MERVDAASGLPAILREGGDWGAVVTTAIAVQDTEHCLGVHLNMPIVRREPATMNNLWPKIARELGVSVGTVYAVGCAV